MSDQPLTADASLRTRKRIRLFSVILATTALTSTFILSRRLVVDERLVGRWEWSADREAGSPMQLNRNGSATVMVSIGCFCFPRSCRWAVEGDELKLYPAPQLEALTLDAARKYLGDCWTSHFTTPEPLRRFQIVERTEDRLSLRPLENDGSMSDAAIEVYGRAVEK